MSVDPKEPERGIFTDSFQIPSSCACSSRSEFNSTASDDITTSTTRPSASFFGKGLFKYYVIMILTFFDPPTHLIIRRHHFLHIPHTTYS